MKLFREVTINSYLDGGAVTTVTVLPEHAHLSRKEFASQYPENVLAMKARMFDLVYEQVIQGSSFDDMCGDALMDSDNAWCYTKYLDQSQKVETLDHAYAQAIQNMPTEVRNNFEQSLLQQMRDLRGLRALLRSQMSPKARAISDKAEKERMKIEQERWGNVAAKHEFVINVSNEDCEGCKVPIPRNDVTCVDCPGCGVNIGIMCSGCATESMMDDLKEECETGRCRSKASANDESELPEDIIAHLEHAMEERESAMHEDSSMETSSEAHKTAPPHTLVQMQ